MLISRMANAPHPANSYRKAANISEARRPPHGMIAALRWIKDKGMTQCCSFKKNSVRPEPVEGLLVGSGWFDKALLSLSKGSPRTVK